MAIHRICGLTRRDRRTETTRPRMARRRSELAANPGSQPRRAKTENRGDVGARKVEEHFARRDELDRLDADQNNETIMPSDPFLVTSEAVNP
jgi:hypothetical protein